EAEAPVADLQRAGTGAEVTGNPAVVLRMPPAAELRTVGEERRIRGEGHDIRHGAISSGRSRAAHCMKRGAALSDTIASYYAGGPVEVQQDFSPRIRLTASFETTRVACPRPRGHGGDGRPMPQTHAHVLVGMPPNVGNGSIVRRHAGAYLPRP